MRELRRGVRAGESRSLPLPLRPPLRARRSASRAGLSGEWSREDVRECAETERARADDARKVAARDIAAPIDVYLLEKRAERGGVERRGAALALAAAALARAAAAAEYGREIVHADRSRMVDVEGVECCGDVVGVLQVSLLQRRGDERVPSDVRRIVVVAAAAATQPLVIPQLGKHAVNGRRPRGDERSARERRARRGGALDAEARERGADLSAAQRPVAVCVDRCECFPQLLELVRAELERDCVHRGLLHRRAAPEREHRRRAARRGGALEAAKHVAVRSAQPRVLERLLRRHALRRVDDEEAADEVFSDGRDARPRLAVHPRLVLSPAQLAIHVRLHWAVLAAEYVRDNRALRKVRLRVALRVGAPAKGELHAQEDVRDDTDGPQVHSEAVPRALPRLRIDRRDLLRRHIVPRATLLRHRTRRCVQLL